MMVGKSFSITSAALALGMDAAELRRAVASGRVRTEKHGTERLIRYGELLRLKRILAAIRKLETNMEG